ncbi:tRNA (cytosine(72)-C(5))-methyltransferase NSUN6 [Aethina tumida]|uniref:tRNA (cytosine(72)-C(5))-methyltransferase NSUN6 n=1 Tax=Aethina tumida TaxID=116153 RepID=UPI0021492E41|nr:tRNA (cytosine(72)-C(5))-methyltransferase NSUN6 [Aethina tumida]
MPRLGRTRKLLVTDCHVIHRYQRKTSNLFDTYKCPRKKRHVSATKTRENYGNGSASMVYPDSPFGCNFDCDVLLETAQEKSPHAAVQNFELHDYLKWLCASPNYTSFRVNTLRCTTDDVRKDLQLKIDLIFGNGAILVEKHDKLQDVLIIKHPEVTGQLGKHEKEVIVDAECATAVLRGAHIFAPGILGMLSGTQLGDKVSVYADISKKCKKGLQKVYPECDKIFVANGIAKMQRQELFGENLTPNGIAVEISETISGCPSIPDNILDTGLILLQNVPSIICVQNLNPQPREVILDMCASPGNKTTHIAALMKNKGVLIALDKTIPKVIQLKKRCEEFGTKVLSFQADSTKILDSTSGNLFEEGPPFRPETFDRILLDAPCSAVGRRPQLLNTSSEKVIRSYVPLQRKLFETAVSLLKPGGRLTYSTCTITLAENEGLVAWALKKFDCLEIVKQDIHLGGCGLSGSDLTEEQRKLVQRFGPYDGVDSVGFFICCFNKKI